MTTTVAMAFAVMPKSDSPQARGRIGEPAAYTYYRCMVVAYGSLRRFNPGADLVLVTTDPVPAPFAGELAAIGVEVLVEPFAHRPPEGYGHGWLSSLFHLDAVAALAGRGGTLVMIDPDMFCLRPLDALLAACGDAVGVQTESAQDMFHRGEEAAALAQYARCCDEMHRDLGEPDAAHPKYSGSFYVLPGARLPLLLERIERAWELALERHARGAEVFHTDEHFMNYAVRAVEVRELSAHVRVVPTAPWRRYLTDRDVILGLTLWNLMYEKELGFQRLYPAAADRGSWFWTASDEVFRERAGKVFSATGRSGTRRLAHVAGGVVERLTTERMQKRLKPVYTRMVQVRASMRTV
ncbi:hypothetical protein ABT160_25335 [Streptomyces sp. NPDC001941]|uniref:hypothetical protein n=1 Tax=Streptomyces sp. NPDC001941 TaxID=3154659 RepID=UPI003320A09C